MSPDRSIALVFGTRPEAIKMGPVYRALTSEDSRFRPIVIVSGQHRELLDQMLGVFDIVPTRDLDVMTAGQTPGSLTGALVPALQDAFREEAPDMVLAQGDTSTTFCAALAAFYEQIPVAHLEAGLRTNDKYSPFPEEINRRLTSQIADVHLAPTRRSRHNLQGEGIDPMSIFVTGNTIVDALNLVRDRTPSLADTPYSWVEDLDGRTILTTIHRRENLGVRFTSVCHALLELLERYPRMNLVFPMHPNPKVRTAAQELLGGIPRVHLCEPPDYLVFVALMQCADLIITDSGGIQEEAPGLGIPTLVARDSTERPEGIEAGVAQLVGTDTDSIVNAASELFDNPSAFEEMATGANPYGDGMASWRTLHAIEHFFGLREDRPPDYDWRQAT